MFHYSSVCEFTLDTEPTYNMNLSDLENKEEDCDFYAYMLMTYDCYDAEEKPELIPTCIEKLLEKRPNFYCQVNSVGHDGTYFGIEELTRADLQKKTSLYVAIT